MASDQAFSGARTDTASLSATFQAHASRSMSLQTRWLMRDPVTYPVESPLPRERLPPEAPIVLEDAEIRWGKASQFNYGQRKGPHIKYTVNFKDPDDDEDEEEPEIPTFEFTEVENLRKTSKIRVTSSTDDEVWVDVDRIDEIVFEGPLLGTPPSGGGGGTNGTTAHYKYVLKHPPAPS